MFRTKNCIVLPCSLKNPQPSVEPYPTEKDIYHLNKDEPKVPNTTEGYHNYTLKSLAKLLG